jgi:hypothetical protein
LILCVRADCFVAAQPRGAVQWQKKLDLSQALCAKEMCLASGGKLYTVRPMVSAALVNAKVREPVL